MRGQETKRGVRRRTAAQRFVTRVTKIPSHRPPSTMAASPDSDGFDLLTAIRYDSSLINCPWNSLANQGQSSPFLLLPFHFSRLIAAATLHGWRHAFTPPSWTSFQHACQRAVETHNGPNKGGPLKVSSKFAFSIFRFL